MRYHNMTIFEAVREFWTRDSPRSEWLYVVDFGEIYVRRSKRVLPPDETGMLIGCLDIGNVSIKETGKGIFTKFLSELEASGLVPVIYVENVLDKRFQRFFERRVGYTKIPTFKIEPPVYSYWWFNLQP